MTLETRPKRRRNAIVFLRESPPDLIREWRSVLAKKTRQNKTLKPGSDSIRTDQALAPGACQRQRLVAEHRPGDDVARDLAIEPVLFDQRAAFGDDQIGVLQ